MFAFFSNIPVLIWIEERKVRMGEEILVWSFCKSLEIRPKELDDSDERKR